MENIEKFKQILEEFQNIPKKEQILPTFLEIAGQPHFENVCSNILRYFFDTRESHKFNDLLLKSFLNCVNESYANEHNLATINIYREYSAKKNKRIDLVIECEDLVIVIENKIYHWLANDLDLYEKSINTDYKNIKQKVFIVLSLREETIKTSSFVNITYSTFFNNLKSELGHHFVNANNQYTTFLLDFIKTIENLMNNNNINKEFFDFFIKNKKAIDELINENNNLEKNRVEEINKIASILLSKKENLNMRRADRKNIYINIKLENIDGDIQFQCYFGLSSVISYLRVDNYKGEVYDLLDKLQLIKENRNLNLKRMDRGVGYVIFDEPLKLIDIKAEDFADKIIDIIDKIKFN